MKITAIRQQEKLKDRYSVYVDEKYSFSLSEVALLESGLASGKELSAEELKGFKQLSADDKLYGNALRYAAMRLRSRWELTEYLRRKQASPEASESVMAKLERIGFINDEVFARMWVENRRLLKPTSRRKLQQELKAKRVGDDIVGRVLQEAGDGDHSALQEMIARKRRQAKYRDDEMKLMQYLVRQGFGYDDVKTAVREATAD
jgi:regulatory protein